MTPLSHTLYTLTLTALNLWFQRRHPVRPRTDATRALSGDA